MLMSVQIEGIEDSASSLLMEEIMQRVNTLHNLGMKVKIVCNFKK